MRGPAHVRHGRSDRRRNVLRGLIELPEAKKEGGGLPFLLRTVMTSCTEAYIFGRKVKRKPACDLKCEILQKRQL